MRRRIVQGWHLDRADEMLLAIAILLAASFAWLFYQQRQRSEDNRAVIMLSTHVAFKGYLADRRTGLSLRFILAQIRDNPPSPLSPDLTARRVAIYDRLITAVPVRDCAREFAPLAARNVVTTTRK